MISIYREGCIVNVGLSVGWVNGLIITWKWISLSKDSAVCYYFRIRNKPFSIIRKRSIINDYDKSVVDLNILTRALVLVTQEEYSDLKALKGK